MDILCLTGLFPKNYEHIILSNSISGVQNAANKLQWGLVDGFDEISEVHLNILNSLYIGSYPKRYKQLHIPDFEFTHGQGKLGKNVGFTNLSVYKMYSRYITLKREIDVWARSGNHNDKYVIAYAMTTPFVELLSYIKSHYPNIICCLVVPDLPEYMNAAATDKAIYKLAKKIQIKHFKQKLRPIDGYVFLTDYMKDWFDWPVKYTVVEGIFSGHHVEQAVRCKKKKAVLYAGMLEEKYGLIDLVKAFTEINAPDWALELYGSGSAVEQIKGIAANDSRIHLKGIVPNDIVIEEQKQVELLVNPRNDTQKFTKYSFPSKTMEYMGSGTPMLGYKLTGMPESYRHYFYEISPEKDGMRIALEKAISLTSEERAEKGKSALEFVTEEKNPRVQCDKIVSLLKEIRRSKLK